MALEATTPGAVFETGAVFDNMPSTSDELARAAGLPRNPFPQGSPSRKLADATAQHVKSAVKSMALKVAKKTVKGVLSTGVGAATSLTVGASLGNLIPIPGIGAAVGAIGALVFEGFKALGKALLKLLKKDPPPYQRKCPSYKCPEPPSMPVVELLPWLAQQQAAVGAELVQLRKGGNWCGYGGVVDCSTELNLVAREASKVTFETIPYLGLPQLVRLLQAYRSAPQQYSYLAARAGRRPEMIQIVNRDLQEAVRHMELRRGVLQTLVDRGMRVRDMSMPEVDRLKGDIHRELIAAGTQAQISAGPETLGWFRTLGDVSIALEEREKAIGLERQAANVASGRGAKVAATDPQLQLLQMRCGEGDQNACAEARRKMGQPQKPAGRPSHPAPADVQKRNRFVYDYLQKVAQGGNLAAQMLLADALRQPGQFPAAKTYAYLERRAKEGVQPAKVLLYAAAVEYRKAAQTPAVPPPPTPSAARPLRPVRTPASVWGFRPR